MKSPDMSCSGPDSTAVIGLGEVGRFFPLNQKGRYVSQQSGIIQGNQ